MCSPVGVSFDPAGNLWVLDSDGNRVLEFVPPFTTDMAASTVIGQSTFSSGMGGLSAGSLSINGAYGYITANSLVDGRGNLWVADPSNNRVLEFQLPSLVATHGQVSMNAAGGAGTQQWWDNSLSFPVTVNAKPLELDMRSNSTVTNFAFNPQARVISFTVAGPSGTKGYVNATWPMDLLSGTLKVTMDGNPASAAGVKQVGGYVSLYLLYGHSAHVIAITGTVTPTSTTSSLNPSTSSAATTSSGAGTGTSEFNNAAILAVAAFGVAAVGLIAGMQVLRSRKGSP